MSKQFVILFLGIALQAYVAICLIKYVEHTKRRRSCPAVSYGVQGLLATLLFMLVLTTMPAYPDPFADRIAVFGIFYIALFLIKLLLLYGQMSFRVLLFVLAELIAGIVLISISLSYQPS
jgi:hypothetical protein